MLPRQITDKAGANEHSQLTVASLQGLRGAFGKTNSSRLATIFGRGAESANWSLHPIPRPPGPR